MPDERHELRFLPDRRDVHLLQGMRPARLRELLPVRTDRIRLRMRLAGLLLSGLRYQPRDQPQCTVQNGSGGSFPMMRAAATRNRREKR